MSFDYFVIVHRQEWPTAEIVQNHLEELGYPLRLGATPPGPFSTQWDSPSLPAVFEGRKVTLEAEIDQVTGVGDPDSLFGYIAQAAGPRFAISDGDYVLNVTFRSDVDQIRAGLYLAAAMIKSCNGYGFENQFETHGGSEFADQLLAEAADATAFEQPTLQYTSPAETVPTRPKSVLGFVRAIIRPS